MSTEPNEVLPEAGAESREDFLVRAAGRNGELMRGLVAENTADTLAVEYNLDQLHLIVDRMRTNTRNHNTARLSTELDIAVAFAKLEAELRTAHRTVEAMNIRASNAERELQDLEDKIGSGRLLSPAAARVAAWADSRLESGIELNGPLAIAGNRDHVEADLSLWHSAPVLCVPRIGTFAPLPADVSAHRLLVADTGLWLECRRPWLHLIWPVAPLAPGMEDVALPYGSLTQTVKVAFGRVPHDALREFADLARRALPNEAGAWMAWETYAADVDGGKEGALEWCQPRLSGRWNGGPVISNGGEGCVAVEGTPGRLDYPRPETTDTSTPCIDIHSHGAEPAFFSETDNADDRHDVKIAIVVGSLERPVPTIVARLCCLGVMIPINVRAEEVFGGNS